MNDIKDIVICIKFFQKKEWAEEFIKGNIYANNFQYFVDLESKTGIKGQGDKNELQYSLPLFDIELIDTNTKKTLLVVKKGSGSVYSNFDFNKHVVCFSGISLKELETTSVNGENYYKIPDMYFDGMEEEFGDYCVIFFEYDFIDSVYNHSLSHDLIYEYRCVFFSEPDEGNIYKIENFCNGQLFLYTREEMKKLQIMHSFTNI